MTKPCDSTNNEGTSLINNECPACHNQPIPFDHNTLVDCGTCNEPNNEDKQ